jgi:hypothetical protein
VKLFLVIACLLLFIVVHADDDGKEPPSMQRTPGLDFRFSNRQPKPPVYIIDGIKNLETKKRGEWTQVDSLFYALELTYLENYEKALLYFLGVDTDTLSEFHASRLYQVTLRNTKRYERLVETINRSTDTDEVKQIRKRFIEVRVAVENRKWNYLDSIVFPFLIDSLLNKKSHHNELVSLANSIKKALAYETLLNDNRDVILSKAFEEYGDFMIDHVYLSSGYLAYAIARHYDKRNTALAKKLKDTKKALDNNNFLIPSHRNAFGKIRPDFYAFKTYAEYIPVNTPNGRDFISLDELMKFEKKPDRLSNWDTEILVILCLFIVLVCVVFFVKAKK